MALGKPPRGHERKGTTMSDKAITPTATEYDKASTALDRLNFIGQAITDMMTDYYSDSVVNGLVSIIFDSTAEVRQYVDAARAALLEVEAEE